MLVSFTSFLTLAATFTSFATARPARLDTDSSTSSHLSPRGPFIPIGANYIGLAYQAVNWGNRTFEPEQKWPCITLPRVPGQVGPNNQYCGSHWYDGNEFDAQEGVACPSNTISGEGKSCVSLSDAFLNQNGSLRKRCGKKILVHNGFKSVEAEVRRSCKSATVCPGPNSIALSPYVAKELGVQNDLLNGTEVSWTYLG